MIGERYTIGDLIGQGGMGTVYRGRDKLTGQLVSIKSLRNDLIESDASSVERFEREGEALRRLDHPNIVQMLATVEDNGRHYLVLEYVEGGSLQAAASTVSVQPTLAPTIPPASPITAPPTATPAPSTATPVPIIVAPVGEKELMVLVGGLEPLNTTRTDISRLVLDGLQQGLENEVPFLNSKVREYPIVLNSSAVVQEAALANKASVVVWGNYIERTIALEPDTNFPYVTASIIALREGRVADAIAIIRESVAKFPNTRYGSRVLEAFFGAGVENSLAPLFSAYGNLVIGQFEQTITFANQGIAVDDSLVELYFLRGFAQCNLQQYPEAEESYTRGLALAPDFALLHLLRAEARQKQEGKGLLVFEDLNAVQESPQAEVLAEYVAGAQNGTLSCANILRD
jgi:hypothetical protein